MWATKTLSQFNLPLYRTFSTSDISHQHANINSHNDDDGGGVDAPQARFF